MLLITLAAYALSADRPGSVYSLQASCSGGVAGRLSIVHIKSDGQVLLQDRFDRPLGFVWRMSPREVQALSNRLDLAAFDRLETIQRKRVIPDGLNCSITRVGRTRHRIEFLAGASNPTPELAVQYREVRAVMTAIFQAAKPQELNPQPIPPDGSVLAPRQ